MQHYSLSAEISGLQVRVLPGLPFIPNELYSSRGSSEKGTFVGTPCRNRIWLRNARACRSNRDKAPDGEKVRCFEPGFLSLFDRPAIASLATLFSNSNANALSRKKGLDAPKKESVGCRAQACCSSAAPRLPIATDGILDGYVPALRSMVGCNQRGLHRHLRNAAWDIPWRTEIRCEREEKSPQSGQKK